MAANKTKPEPIDPVLYLKTIDNEQKQADSFELMELIGRLTGEPAVMWGTSIVGFGSYHYKYDSGREGDMCLSGFAPRKTALTIYIMNGFADYPDLMEKLGKYKTGKSCLYEKKAG